MLALHVASSPDGQLVLALTRICHKASLANFSSKAFQVRDVAAQSIMNASR
jgi:hypothetical protein